MRAKRMVRAGTLSYVVRWVVACIVLGWMTSTHAATVQYTANFSFTHTGSVSSGVVSIGGTFNNTVVTSPAATTLPRFDPALGRLTGVDVTVNTTTATFSITPSGLVSLVSSASATRTLAYVLTAGTTTANGSNAVTNSGPSLVSQLGLGTTNIGGAPLAADKPFSLTSDLAQFTGTGTFNVTLTATNAFSVTTTVSALNGAGFTGTGTYAGAAVVTYTYVPTQTISGFAYLDANHNATLDAGEAGTGVAIYAKLATYVSGSCQAPALSAATVNTSTGAYALTGDQGGTYCVVLDNNATLTDVTPTLPTGYLATENPSGIRIVALSTSALTAQNFGLYAGSSVAGRVFTDNGAGGGTANDGIANGTEAAVAGATVAALSGGTTLAATTTDATGAYTLFIPSTASGTIGIAETPPSGTIAVGAAVGTTGGTYARATNAVSFTFAAATAWTGVNFGNVAANAFGPSRTLTTGPGAVVPYAHSFVAGSTGQLTFSTAAVSTPSAAWTQSVILDANCNGVVDAGETAVSGAIAVTTGQTVCIVVRDTSPAATANGAQDVVTVSAVLAYSNASPALSVTTTVTDTTSVSTTILLQLAEQVRNVTKATAFTTANAAAPNEVLEYQLTATNPAAIAVTAVVVNATVPTYTAFVAAACPSSLPSGLTACSVTTQPAAGAQGAVQWTFTGALNASATVAVTYQVRVNQ